MGIPKRRRNPVLFVILFVLILFAVLTCITRLNSTNSVTYSGPPQAPCIHMEEDLNSEDQMYDNMDASLPAGAVSPFLNSRPISKDVIVHSTHFDDRARNGHRNIYLFMVGANRTIIDSKWIVGCAVRNSVSRRFSVNFTVEDLNIRRLLESDKPFPYEEVIIECYDLPKMKEGSSAYILYKTDSSSPVYVVESEHPLSIPAPRVKPSGQYNFTVVTCTKMHDGNAAWTREFIKYQEAVGVDHVHVNAMDTFIKEGGMKTLASDQFVAGAQKNGFLSFDVWTEWYKSSSELRERDIIKQSEIYVHSEQLRKLDCIYKFRGTYDYVFILDTDDFFNPRITGISSVKHYIQEWFADESVGSFKFDWILYYPRSCGVKDGPIENGNVTSKLKSYKSHVYSNKKSLHKTSAIVQASFHDASCRHCLMPGYKVVQVPAHVAYVAHLRNTVNPPHGGC